MSPADTNGIQRESPHTGHRLPPRELQSVPPVWGIFLKIQAGHEVQGAGNGRPKRSRENRHMCLRTDFSTAEPPFATL